MDNCIKILIADADEGFTSDLACYLKTNSSFDVVGAANDGEKAVRLLRAAQPNVLILDLLLPKLDGLSVLKEASALPKPPIGLVLTNAMTDFAAQAAEKYGARYFLSKPCKLKMIAERVGDIITAERVTRGTRYLSANVEALVTSMIHDVGVPAHVKGYQYLREAIMMAVDDKDVMRAITKFSTRRSRGSSIRHHPGSNAPSGTPSSLPGSAAMKKRSGSSSAIRFRTPVENQQTPNSSHFSPIKFNCSSRPPKRVELPASTSFLRHRRRFLKPAAVACSQALFSACFKLLSSRQLPQCFADVHVQKH